MPNIVISRIQNRRGRRENLPQPLLPAEIALTSDTAQAWIGQDPVLAVPSINVYTDKLGSTAQGIVDDNILETRFDENMTVTIFNTLVSELGLDVGVTLVAGDILWDDTYRGTIETITVDAPGSGYSVNDPITAISATGSGFTGEVASVGGGGEITGVTLLTGGINYRSANTTFSITSGGGGTLGTITQLTFSDIYGSTVHIAANPTIDAGNTIANIDTTIDGLSPTITNRLMGDPNNAAFGGTFISNSLIVDNHTEAANVVALINRINGTTPGQVTGLVFTNLNIELTTDNDDITSFQVAASDLTTVITSGTNNAYFRMPRSMIVSEVRGSLLTASTSGAVTIDINKNGNTILSTKLTIDQDEKTSLTAAAPAVISDDILANDDEITVDIDAEGTGAIGLIITLIGIA